MKKLFIAVMSLLTFSSSAVVIMAEKEGRLHCLDGCTSPIDGINKDSFLSLLWEGGWHVEVVDSYDQPADEDFIINLPFNNRYTTAPTTIEEQFLPDEPIDPVMPWINPNEISCKTAECVEETKPLIPIYIFDMGMTGGWMPDDYDPNAPIFPHNFWKALK